MMGEAIRKQKTTVLNQSMVDRLREAIRQQPDRMTLQLAREFGVPEVEVVRRFPDDREAGPHGWADDL
jgi:putative heme iron utilization protein